jgi:nitroreductase
METKTLFEERRSVGDFDKSKDLEETLLKEIINMAVLAPSAFNLQPWRIIAVKTEEGKKKLYNLANQQERILEAPVTLIIIGNKDGASDSNPVWDELLQTVGGKQEIVDGAKKTANFLYSSSDERRLKFAESNAGLLALSVMIAAKEFGVDTHPMSGIDFDGIPKEFGFVKDETAVMIIAMGYRDKTKKMHPRRSRLQFDEIVSIV